MSKRPSRTHILLAGLVIAVAVWAGLLVKDYRWHRWLANASQANLRNYVAEHPDHPEALQRLGVLARNRGDRKEAEKLLRHAVELAPDSEQNWIELSRSLADDKEAISTLEAYLKVAPESASTMAELAHRELQSGSFSSAEATSKKATEIGPLSPDAWRVWGDVLAAAGKSPDAEKAYKKALSLRDDPDSRLSLARLWIPLQRYGEIIEICAPVIGSGSAPNISLEHRARALLYTAGARLYGPLTQEETTVLRQQLEEADALSAQLTPGEQFLPPYFLGELYLRIGKPAAAIPFLERSVNLGPTFAGSIYSLARAYRLSGDSAKADAATALHTRISAQNGELEQRNERVRQH